MRTLTPEQALACATNNHCLGSPGRSIESVAGQIVGLHNTSQVTPYLSMRARIDTFERSDLDTMMWDRWNLARFRAMRHTMFIFPVDLLEIAAAATRHITEPLAARWLRDSGMGTAEFERLSAEILEALSDGPLTSRQLRAELAVPQTIDLPTVVSRLCELGKVIGGAPPGSWRSNVRRFHLWSDVLPHVDPARWNEDDAVTELIRRYIAGYGPVTVADMAWWTGFSKKLCRRVLEALGDEIEEVVVDGWPGPLYLHAGVGPATASETVKALPLLDPYVQGYRDRSRLMDERRQSFVYDGGGNSSATLVHLGRVIGIWQPIRKPPSIRFHLFDEYPEPLLPEVGRELEGVAHTYFDQCVDLAEVPDMAPLTGSGGARSAAHPLDGVLHRAGKSD